MKFQVGDIVVQRGYLVWAREMVKRTYQDRWSNECMTVQELGPGRRVRTNCRMEGEGFVLYPYFPRTAVVKRAKQALAPDKAFKIGKRTYLVLPRWKIPELMTRVFITDGLLAEPASLAWALEGAGKSYKEYCQEAEAAGKKPVSPVAYVYEILMPLENYDSRWW